MSNRVGSIDGWPWRILRNNVDWLFMYVLQEPFIDTPPWRALLRISHSLFVDVSNALRPKLTRSNTIIRKALKVDVRVAAFLLWRGSKGCEHVARKLGIGASSVPSILREVLRGICSYVSDAVQLPRNNMELFLVMDGLERLSGLPYCVCAVNGSHIKLHCANRI